MGKLEGAEGVPKSPRIFQFPQVFKFSIQNPHKIHHKMQNCHLIFLSQKEFQKTHKTHESAHKVPANNFLILFIVISNATLNARHPLFKRKSANDR